MGSKVESTSIQFFHRFFLAIPLKPFNMDSTCTTSREGKTEFDPTDVQQYTFAEKSSMSSTGTGIIMGKGKNLKVHVVPSSGENLPCIPQLFDRGIATVFHPTYGVMIADAKNMNVTCAALLRRGRYVDGTFLLDLVIAKKTDKKFNSLQDKIISPRTRSCHKVRYPTCSNTCIPINKAILWCKGLGYVSPHKIIDALVHGLVTGVNLK